MGAARFEVELRDGRGPAVRHAWSATQLVDAVAGLRRANAQGADVFLRPAGEHALVLVGGLDASGLDRLTRDGFAPAATVEVGPGRFEAWVKLAAAAVPRDVRRAAAAGLARRCNGLGQVGDEPPFGRLAGLAHPAWDHGRSALSTVAWARDCHGRVAPAAATYLARVERALNAARQAQARPRPVDPTAPQSRGVPRPTQREQSITLDRDRG